MDSSCNECIKGSIHSGQPQGIEKTIHGLNTYVIGNTQNPSKIIVIYSDVFGLALPNNKLIADAYAKSNGEWLVYLPDFFKGDPVSLSIADVLIPVDAAKQSTFSKYTGILANAPSFVMWLTRHKQAQTDQVCMDFLRALRQATPSQKIGMVGFCWGGRYALRAGLEANMTEKEDGSKIPLVDAVVALHPSNLVLPGDIDTLVVPFSCGWGEEDVAVNIKQKAEVGDFYAKIKESGNKVPEMEHNVYRPGRHGFAVRGNPDDPQERACLEDSVTQVLKWFEKWL